MSSVETGYRPVSFLHHPFKIALMTVRRTFGRSRLPDAIAFDGFRSETIRYYDEAGGERIWLVYRVRLSEGAWWRCTFTDARLVVEQGEKVLWELPYRDVVSVTLPEKSEIIARRDTGAVSYDTAWILSSDGTEYMVLGGTDEDGMTGVYMWHSFVGGICRDLVVSDVRRNLHGKWEGLKMDAD